MKAPALEASLRIGVSGPGGHFVVRSELRLERGVLVFYGPSGAGKSLTLQALAGLIRPREGILRVRGRTLYDSARKIDLSPHRRRLGYVPQHHSLFPFCDVSRNVAFGLRRAERHRHGPPIQALLAELGISHLARSRPGSLSGGERQRVALARALAVRPHLLLLDEPFASIDPEGRSVLRRTLRATLQRHGIPAVLVTHDLEEAFELADSVALFRPGHPARTTDPAALRAEAGIVLLEAEAEGPPRPLGDGRARLPLKGGSVEAPADLLSGRRLRLGLRPFPGPPPEEPPEER